MGDFLKNFVLASQRAPGLRVFQILSHNDLAKLETFFLSFDLDQRREYFGGDTSDDSVRHYCRRINWSETTVIARADPYCLEAIATVTALGSDRRSAELSMACPLLCNRQPIVSELFDLAMLTASISYRQLIVHNDLAMPELMSLLRGHVSARFDGDVFRIDVPIGNARIVAC